MVVSSDSFLFFLLATSTKTDCARGVFFLGGVLLIYIESSVILLSRWKHDNSHRMYGILTYYHKNQTIHVVGKNMSYVIFPWIRHWELRRSVFFRCTPGWVFRARTRTATRGAGSSFRRPIFRAWKKKPRFRCLGGGNSNIFYVHPYLGKISKFD